MSPSDNMEREFKHERLYVYIGGPKNGQVIAGNRNDKLEEDFTYGMRVTLAVLDYIPGSGWLPDSSCFAIDSNLVRTHNDVEVVLLITGLWDPEIAWLRLLSQFNEKSKCDLPTSKPDPTTADLLQSMSHKLDALLAGQKTTERKLSDLSDAVAALAGDVSTLSTDSTSLRTDFDAGVAALQAAVASGNSADVNTAVAAIVALRTQVQAVDATTTAMDAAAKALVAATTTT